MKFKVLLLSLLLFFPACSVWDKIVHDMKEEATAPIDPETGEPIDIGDDAWDYDGIISDVLRLGSTFWPPLLAAEGIFTLFSRRKRRHYIDAVKAVIPHNGKVELKNAGRSIGRAVGLAHSSEQTKELFEKPVV